MAGPQQSLDDVLRNNQPENTRQSPGRNNNWYPPYNNQESGAAGQNDYYRDGVNDLPPAPNYGRRRRDTLDDYSEYDEAYQFLSKELQKIRVENAKFALSKKRSFFTLQIFMGYSLAVLLIIMILTFSGLFMYVTFREGMLSETGMGSAILNTIQEIFRILFSPDVNF